MFPDAINPAGAGTPAELLFLPLGGAGEIGMNLNLYGYGAGDEHRWLMIDCGVSFGGDGIPGSDVIMADPSFIAERRHQLDGLLLTHAHEDHLGAVAYLWPRLRCPIYATPFAMASLRRKLAGCRFQAEVPLRLIPDDGRLSIGPFDLQVIGVTHSIPEARAVAIRTPLGLVLHTGDWKLDPEPVVGPASDEAALRALGDEGVDAIVCDSTNVFEEGKTGSEGALEEALNRLVAGCRQRVVVTCFATNIARIATIAAVARAQGRDVVMSGASLKRHYAAALECGYLAGLPPFLDDALVGKLPRERTLIVCTGGQGEPRAALAKIAEDEHPYLSLDPGDTVIFSTRVIPGNERPIARLQNLLVRLGVEMLTQRHGLIHVSGHPARGDLAEMYRLVRPRVAIPVHGELRHLLEHRRFAQGEGTAETIAAENGTLVRLAPAPARIVDHVRSGRLLLEGNRTVPVQGDLVQGRLKVIYNGAVVVTVVVDGQNVQDVQMTSMGLVEKDEASVVDALLLAARRAAEKVPAAQSKEDETVREAVRVAIRRTARLLIDKRPLTHVHLVRR